MSNNGVWHQNLSMEFSFKENHMLFKILMSSSIAFKRIRLIWPPKKNQVLSGFEPITFRNHLHYGMQPDALPLHHIDNKGKEEDLLNWCLIIEFGTKIY